MATNEFQIPNSYFLILSLHDRRVVLLEPGRLRKVPLRREDDLIDRKPVLAHLHADPLRTGRLEINRRSGDAGAVAAGILPAPRGDAAVGAVLEAVRHRARGAERKRRRHAVGGDAAVEL